MDSPYYKLSRTEIDIIRAEVAKSEISFSHLEEELIDHICCMAEEFVSNGYSFDEAFGIIREEIDKDTLKSIEIQTLILINKKFQVMKKTLKITGITGLSLVIISAILKINHWPGAGILLTLSIVIFLLAYLPVLFFALKREKIMKRKMYLSGVGIFTAGSLLISFLFSLMHWPYREYTIVLAWLFVLVFIIMFFYNIMKSEENRVLNLSVLLFFVVLFIIDVSLVIISLKNPSISSLTVENNIESCISLYNHKTETTYRLIDANKNDSLRHEIVDFRTNTNKIIGEIEHVRDALFRDKSDKEDFNKQFLKKSVLVGNVEEEAIKLGYDMEKYKDFLLKKTSIVPELNGFITNSIRFGKAEFNKNPAILYNNLQKLIRDIKIAESEYLNTVLSGQDY